MGELADSLKADTEAEAEHHPGRPAVGEEHSSMRTPVVRSATHARIRRCRARAHVCFSAYTYTNIHRDMSVCSMPGPACVSYACAMRIVCVLLCARALRACLYIAVVGSALVYTRRMSVYIRACLEVYGRNSGGQVGAAVIVGQWAEGCISLALFCHAMPC